MKAVKINAACLRPVQKLMRLWSIHPSYLDTVGLVALWREGLLARKVLLGQTKGYTRHPQLIRFRDASDPVQTLDFYLKTVYDEAVQRGYRFDLQKIAPPEHVPFLPIPDKQLEHEFRHLLNKLQKRTPQRYDLLHQTAAILPHPLFQIVQGNICSWEKA